MGFEILDVEDFLKNGAIFEAPFFERIRQFDWQQFSGKRVLIRGCASKLIPPWAYMVLTAKLAHVASTVYFGSEHNRIPIFNQRTDR